MKRSYHSHLLAAAGLLALVATGCADIGQTDLPASEVDPAAQVEPTAEPESTQAEPEPTAQVEPTQAEPATQVAIAPEKKTAAPSETGAGSQDWNQWGGSNSKNNTPEATGIPTEWDVESGKNIKWVSPLGSQTYGNPVIANGQVYVGTNNGSGYIARFPNDVDLGCLLAFRESDGKFLWQHSSEKLPTGRVHDWPLQGICCAPLIEGERGWYVNSRGEVVCFDTQGFYDGENDGPYQDEEKDLKGNKIPDLDLKTECDVVWKFDMMGQLGVSQHNMCACSVAGEGDLLFVNTSNGLDETHINLPAPDAPSFMVMNKSTGKVLWTDKSPGTNILHGQWSSPAYGVLGGVPQLLFAGGDGWLYSFAPEGENGKSKLLWKFDCNPKDSKWILGGRGTRNNLIATPVIYNGLVYIAVGQDPEHGEGVGHLWCIDPTKRGDVSPNLVFNAKDNFKTPVPHKRLQAAEEEAGDAIRDNPNSALVWHYDKFDLDGNGKFDFEESLHRTCGTVAIKDDILYLADFSGLFHCVDAKTGKLLWTYDMLAASWGSALIVGDHVYIGDEDGDLAIFKHSADPKDNEPIEEIPMGNAVYTTAVVANGVLYISNRTHLYAIEAGAQLKAAGGE